MHAEWKQKIVAALPLYHQCRGTLRDEHRYCVLGAICDIVDRERWHKGLTKGSRRWCYGEEQGFPCDTFPPCDVLETVGLSHRDAETLSELNDAGVLFPQLATYIEVNL